MKTGDKLCIEGLHSDDFIYTENGKQVDAKFEETEPGNYLITILKPSKNGK
jgi:hypothetical protein